MNLNVQKKYLCFIVIFLTIIFMSCLCYIRLRIAYNVGIDFDTCNEDLLDRAFYIRSALNFDEFNINADNPLIKNRGYIWLLLFAHAIGVTPHILSAIFWIFAAVFGYVLIKKVSKSYALAIGVFWYILFTPMAFTNISGEEIKNDIYRNIMYVYFAFLYIEILFLLFYEIKRNNKNKLNFVLSLLCGIFFTINYFLSETGDIHLMILLGFSLLFFIYIICLMKFYKKKINIFLHLILIFLPFIIFIISFNIYKFINYRTYGVYTINFRTEGEVGRFISNIQDIDSDKQDSHYWCSIDQLKKAYEVSDTLKKNKQFYDCLVESGVTGFVSDVGYKGDFLGWGITIAIATLKIEYKDANLMFKCINNEIENAYKYGKLTRAKKFKLTKTLGRLTKEELGEVCGLTKKLINELFTMNSLPSLLTSYGNSIDKSKKYVSFFNVNQNTKKENIKPLVLFLISQYKLCNKLLFNLCKIIILLIITYNVFNLFLYKLKKQNKSMIFTNYNIYFALSICFGTFYILYSFAIASFLIWMEKDIGNITHIYYYYASVAIVFLFLFFAFMLASVIYLYKDIISKFNIDYNTVFIISEFIIISFSIFCPLKCISNYRCLVATNKNLEIDFTCRKISTDDIDNAYLDYHQIDKLYINEMNKDYSVSVNFANKDLIDNITIIEISPNKYIENYFTNNFKYNKNDSINNIDDIFSRITNANSIIILRMDKHNIENNMTILEFKLFLEKVLDKALSNAKMIYILPLGQNINCINETIQNDIIDNYYNYVINKSTSIYKNAYYINLEKIYKKYITYPEINSYTNYDTDIASIVLKSISKTLNLN